MEGQVTLSLVDGLVMWQIMVQKPEPKFPKRQQRNMITYLQFN